MKYTLAVILISIANASPVRAVEYERTGLTQTPLEELPSPTEVLKRLQQGSITKVIFTSRIDKVDSREVFEQFLQGLNSEKFEMSELKNSDRDFSWGKLAGGIVMLGEGRPIMFSIRSPTGKLDNFEVGLCGTSALDHYTLLLASKAKPLSTQAPSASTLEEIGCEYLGLKEDPLQKMPSGADVMKRFQEKSISKIVFTQRFIRIDSQYVFEQFLQAANSDKFEMSEIKPPGGNFGWSPLAKGIVVFHDGVAVSFTLASEKYKLERFTVTLNGSSVSETMTLLFGPKNVAPSNPAGK
jgi:hypothetical protein